jgi:G3E family GTPase
MMPLTLLVGFLGAGKTRFLTEVIPALHSRGLRPRVILNDFSNAAIDASRLALLDALVTPLNGECVCCGSLRELMDLLQSTTGVPGDVMLIEANGATETDELLGYLTMDSRLAHFTLPLQVTVVDASRWQRRWFNNTLEAEQTRTATHIRLNWTDRLKPARLSAVEASIREINPSATLTSVEQFADVIADIEREARNTPTRPDPRASSTPHDVTGHTGHTRHAHRHPFASATMPLPPHVDRDAFLAFVRSLPPSIVRAKGLVRFTDKPQEMFVWNRIGGRKQLLLDPSSPHATAKPVALFIGADLPLDALEAAVSALAPVLTG